MGKMTVKDLGPCEMVWDPDGANISLSPMFGTATFKSELLTAVVKEDGKGDIPAGEVTIGRLVTVEAPLTKATLNRLSNVIFGATSGSGASGANLKVINKVGEDLADSAKELIVKPMIDNVASTDQTTWLHIHKCHPKEKIELPFDVGSQRVTIIEFQAYPDDASGNVGGLYRFGME